MNPSNVAGNASQGLSPSELVADADAVQVCCNLLEGSVGCGTNGLDRSQANDNDQSEHDRVLNSCWAIFRLQKLLYFVEKLLHLGLPPTETFPE